MSRILAVLLLLTAVPAAAAPLSVVTTDPDPAPGTAVALEVRIDAVEVGCFSFSVEYDPAVLSYLGADEGPLFSGAPELTYFSDDTDALGRPQPNDCLLGYQTTVSGPGTIAVLHFSVLVDGATTVTLRDAVLRDADRLPLPGVGDPAVTLGATSTGVDPTDPATALSAHPNPSSRRMSLVLGGRAPSRGGRLVIFDVAGRRVRELDWPAGATSLGWDGRDAQGRPVANGVYHARLQMGTTRVDTRIVRVR